MIIEDRLALIATGIGNVDSDAVLDGRVSMGFITAPKIDDIAPKRQIGKIRILLSDESIEIG